MVALAVTTTGLTRWTFFWATTHSLSEWFMIFGMVKIYIKINSRKTFNLIFFLFVGIYYLIDLILSMTLDIDTSSFIVAFMGAPIDFSAFVGWVIMYFKKKIRLFPMLAFSFHIIYIILVFINCLFPPWGRIAGLALNTLAILFASFPANESSWRFSEFITQMIEADKEFKQMTRKRSNSESSANSQQPLSEEQKENNFESESESENEETQEMSEMT